MLKTLYGKIFIEHIKLSEKIYQVIPLEGEKKNFQSSFTAWMMNVSLYHRFDDLSLQSRGVKSFSVPFKAISQAFVTLNNYKTFPISKMSRGRNETQK